MELKNQPDFHTQVSLRQSNDTVSRFSGILWQSRQWMRRLVGQSEQSQESVIEFYASHALPDGTPEDIEYLRARFRAQLLEEIARDRHSKDQQKKLTVVQAVRPERSRTTPRRRRDPQREAICAKVREMHEAGLSHQQMAQRLAGQPRPPRAVWRDLDWPTAYRKYLGAVKKWLSDACRSR